MSGSKHPLKVCQELVRTYAQRRNLHLVSISRDGERRGHELDPYAFVDGDEDFSFVEKKDKGGEREVGKKHKVPLCFFWDVRAFEAWALGMERSMFVPRNQTVHDVPNHMFKLQLDCYLASSEIRGSIQVNGCF